MKLLPFLRVLLLIQCLGLAIWYFTNCGRSSDADCPGISEVKARTVGVGVGRPPHHPRATSCKSLEDIPLEEVTSDDISSCHQFDPFLLSYIKARHVIPPSKLAYNFSPQPMPPGEIVKAMWPLLQKQTHGKKKKIFVEAGASDGISRSNSIWLEESKGWTGVLIECHPEAVPTLLERHRKAFIVDTCLSKTEYPATATLRSVDGWHFSSSLGNGAIFPDFAKSFTDYEIQTLPLYSILAALDITTVDFFSLDIQSQEPYVLRTFPFDRIFVKVWVIEINLITPKEKDEVIQLMVSNGYIVSSMLSNGESDLVFISKRKKEKN